MASRLAFRRVPSNLLNHIATPVRRPVHAAGAISSKSFTTDIRPTDDHDIDEPQRRHDPTTMSRRRGDFFPSSSLLSDWIDPFTPTRTLGQVFNLVDQLGDPFGGSRVGGLGYANRGWDVKEDEKALHLSVDMPGLGKEDVKVSVEKDTLVVKGEGKSAGEEDGESRKYSSRIQLPSEMYKLKEIKGEMKNGVLKLVVPKVDEGEGKKIVEVQVE